jgi:photosystem II stability/assembly factor-like uncharacterized protein
MKVTAVFLFLALIALFIFQPEKKSLPSNSFKAEENPDEDYFFAQHSFPYGKIDRAAHRAAAAAYRGHLAAGTRDAAPWAFAGPVNIGGRLVDVEYHPSDPDIAFLCAASGGVFKTTDGGANWFPVFDEQSTQSIGDLAFAPSNPDVIYVGTGEANGGSGSLTYDANGVYKSIDGGTTWTNIGLEETSMIGRVAVHPTDPEIVLVAAMGDMYGNNSERGLFKTTDGGVTWTNVLYVNDSTGAVDVVINPQNPDLVFACTWMRTRDPNSKDYAGVESGLWKSTDGGETFTRLDQSNGLPSTNNQYSRPGIDLCAAQPNVLYCLYLNNEYNFHGIYKSTDDGETWNETNDNSLSQSMGSGQGYWYGRVKCHPVNPAILYLIGFDVYKTTNGGASYSLTFADAHVDQHEIDFHPEDPATLMLGNDGGLYYSSSAGSDYTKDYTLPVTQVYRAGIDPADVSRLFCGTQDNGTSYTPTGSLDDFWFLFGGDGFQSLVYPGESNVMLVGYQYGNIFKTNDGGYSWDYSSDYGVTGQGNWNYPLTADPNDADVVYTGTQQVFRSENFGSSWEAISPELVALDNSGTLVYGTITFIDVSPVNSDIIYAGTDNGKVWITQNGGNSWQQINEGLPVRWVTCVEADPLVETVAYVTLSGYRFHDEMSHVYRTEDYGATWTPIGGDLPDVPCNSFIADPATANTYYLATDVGVYYTINGGENWLPAGTGMPVVPCLDLKLHQPTRTLVAGTYGRGLYTMNLDLLLDASPAPQTTFDFSVYPNPVTGDFIQAAFTLPQNEEVLISLIDMNGKRISEQKFSGVNGKNLRRVSVNGAAAGIYFLRLEAGDRVSIEKLMVN